MGRKQAARVVAGVLGVVLAWGAFPATAASAQTPGSRFTAAQIAAGRNLLTYVPDSFRLTCTLQPLDRIPIPPGIVADVECRPNASGIDGIEYEQFTTAANMQTEYTNLQQHVVNGPALAGCTADAPYSIAGQPAGHTVCVSDSLGPKIFYTYTPLLVVATISQYNDSTGAPDITALNDFSSNSAGPIPTPGEIPSLLSAAEASRADAELRSHLPAAIAKRCTTNDVAPTPWESASLSCEKPSKGVFSASYDEFRDDVSYANAFDPDTAAARSEKKNSVCPTTGTWSAHGKQQGSYACWVDNAKTTHLEWGVDSQRIVAFASAQSGDGFTGAQFLHWWDTKGAIKP